MLFIFKSLIIYVVTKFYYLLYKLYKKVVLSFFCFFIYQYEFLTIVSKLFLSLYFFNSVSMKQIVYEYMYMFIHTISYAYKTNTYIVCAIYIYKFIAYLAAVKIKIYQVHDPQNTHMFVELVFTPLLQKNT